MNPRPDMEHNIVTVTDIAMPGDAGVAKIDNFVVFIPGAVPGDRVAVRIIKREKRFGYGELDRYRRGVCLSGPTLPAPILVAAAAAPCSQYSTQNSSRSRRHISGNV